MLQPNMWFRPWALSLLASPVLASLYTRDGPQPFSVPITSQWDGDDGNWSSFAFEIGNPFQQVRLLPSTSGSVVAPILSSACANTTCSAPRGNTFNPGPSTSWNNVGDYQFASSANQAGILGDSASADYGTDQVQLSWPGTVAPTLSNQLIAGLVQDSFGLYYLGQFGLTSRSVNFTNDTTTYQSPLTELSSSNQIPSASYGYSAGFYGNDPPAFGSLILGGYDSTLFQPNNVTFPFNNETSRDLIVAIQDVTSNKANGTLLPTPSYAFIDSEIPTIILPLDACHAFENAFNLTYYHADNGQGYYLLNNSQHQNLLAANPSITFTLGPSLTSGPNVNISIPYAAFDLELTPPLGQIGGARYFPLQQGQNASEYVLGRTFLQQAYLIVDYERSNFTVAQALHPQNTSPQIQTITAAYPSGSSSSSSGASSSSSSSGLSGGAIAGIVVGVVVGLAIIALLAFFLIRRRRRQTRQRKTEAEAAVPAVSKDAPTPDSENKERVTTQSPHTGDVQELEARAISRHELSGGEAKKKLGPNEIETMPELEGVRPPFARNAELEGDVASELEA